MSGPSFISEMEAMSQGYEYIVGVDEVGRGSFSGPVVAGAVLIPVEHWEQLALVVDDSKKLSAKKREEVASEVRDLCYTGIAQISPRKVDEVNVLEATKLAMSAAITKLPFYDYALVDGPVDLSNHIDIPFCNIIKGDANCLSIAAASVVAKVFRDALMVELHKTYPMYNWKQNKGYGTREHRNALREFGPSPHHRMTFKGVL